MSLRAWHDRALGRADHEFAEGCVRWAVAQVAGSRTSVAGERSIGSGRVSTRRTETGLVLADLEDWAAARGVSLTFNNRLGTCAFERSGKLAVVPLGAKGFKSGSNWWSYDTPNVAVDRRWFVPLDALEART